VKGGRKLGSQVSHGKDLKDAIMKARRRLDYEGLLVLERSFLWDNRFTLDYDRSWIGSTFYSYFRCRIQNKLNMRKRYDGICGGHATKAGAQH
jgi:hypothetical protein